MKPGPIQYARPESIEEAVELLESREDAKCLAGGQSLLPILNLRLAEDAALVDLARVPGLRGLSRRNGRLSIGAMTTHRTLEGSAEAREADPLIPRLAREIGHLAIRSRGTIGGSLAHADPAAEWPLFAVLVDAELVAVSKRGERRIPARELFAGPLTTTLDPHEILTSVSIPEVPAGTVSGFAELCRRPGDFAVVSVAARLALDPDGRCREAALAVGGADAVPVRITDAERLLAGERPDEASLAEAAELAARTVDPASDVHGSADYRRRMVGVLARRALREASTVQEKELR